MTFLCNRKKAVTDEIKAGANWNRSESQKTRERFKFCVNVKN